MANIVWDIDGVCVNLNKYLLSKAPSFFHQEAINPNAISVREMFLCSKEKETEFWTHHLNLITYSIFQPPRPGLVETMQQIHKNGDRNIVCSARAKSAESGIIGKIIRKSIVNWFKKYQLPVDEFYFVSYKNSALEKMEVCKKVNADVIIEDDCENITLLSQQFPVIKYVTEYNKDLEGEKIYNAENFDSVYLMIQRIAHNQYLNFQFLSQEKRRLLSQEELENYYRQYREILLQMPYLDEKRRKQEQNYKKLFPFMQKFHSIIASKSIVINPEMIEHIQSQCGEGKIYILASHTTLDDIQQVENIIDEMSYFILKQEIERYPIFGKFIDSIGGIYVKRDDAESRRYVRNQAEKLALREKNTLVLPEGTRNRTAGAIIPFQKGALSIAQKTGKFLVPIAIKRQDSEHYVKLKICMPRKIKPEADLDVIIHQLEQEMIEEISNIEDSRKDTGKIKYKK